MTCPYVSQFCAQSANIRFRYDNGWILRLTRPTFSQIFSLGIRRTKYLNCIKLADLLILRFKNWEGIGLGTIRIYLFEVLHTCHNKL